MGEHLNKQNIAAIDPAELTPAMRQYQTYKAQYPDAILFFRIGDFYETFYEDARTVARTLGVALTSRSKGDNAVPMAGVPYHAVDGYLQRMIAAGYRVAICEQMEDPKQAKGVIDRQVTRLITPGTLTEDTMLDGREENFLAAMLILPAPPGMDASADPFAPAVNTTETQWAVIAWCELSTGKFFTLMDSLAACREELARISPRELIYPETPAHARHVKPASAMMCSSILARACPFWVFAWGISALGMPLEPSWSATIGSCTAKPLQFITIVRACLPDCPIPLMRRAITVWSFAPVRCPTILLLPPGQTNKKLWACSINTGHYTVCSSIPKAF